MGRDYPYRVTLHRPGIQPTEEVSRRMKAVRRRDTEPEVEVRRILWKAGARFRLCPQDLPGTPDIANKSARWVVFVHGCFWHGHRNCKLATTPKSNSAFWEAKLAANRRRDARKALALRRLGYRVLVVWQCALRDPAALVRRFSEAGVTKR
ncbi:very short patch repair endonuclease [Myxococcus faecalis]|uniref:very short patch repair endonuclease n=1 Tax=Myxococcus faecalis TaxID=3115646 RepID=UPI0038D18179